MSFLVPISSLCEKNMSDLLLVKLSLEITFPNKGIICGVFLKYWLTLLVVYIVI